MKTFINGKKTFHYTFFLSLFLLNSHSVFADKFANTKIVELREKIFEDNSKLSKIDLEIKNLDTKISDHASRINKFNTTIQKIITTKVELQAKKTKQYETLAVQQKQLLQQLETTYILHRNNNFQKQIE